MSVIGALSMISWWCHQMETFSALLALCGGNSPVTGNFPSQRPVTLSFDVFFDLRLNKWLSKQPWGWWFQLRRHHAHNDITVMLDMDFVFGATYHTHMRPHWCWFAIGYDLENDLMRNLENGWMRTQTWWLNEIPDQNNLINFVFKKNLLWLPTQFAERLNEFHG